MLMEALSIPNIAKEQAKKQHQWGWGDMPDYIDLWAMDGDDFVMPRGFKENFVQGMKLLGHRVEWSDQRVYHQKFRIGDEPDLKPWQVPAMNCIVAECDGMYKAPAGSGKTVAVLATVQKLGCQTPDHRQHEGHPVAVAGAHCAIPWVRLTQSARSVTTNST